ncbi:tyrosine-protein phosphatase [Comamonas sp. Y33R10-2]|nr:tyrosine-protein phosphatase [Comamonas sp. Y33R10-2]
MNSEPIRKQFSLLLQSLASNAGAQVFHCSAGKDRTGWAAAVLLLVLGVPESVVIQDYALSNTYLQASMEKQHAALVKLYGQKLADALVPTLGVSPVFMEAGLQAMKAKYGDVNGYVTQGLALSPADVQALKGRLLRT